MRNFVTRDPEFGHDIEPHDFFLAVASYPTAKKKSWGWFLWPNSRSRVTKFLRKHYTFHTDNELQGSPSVEHPSELPLRLTAAVKTVGRALWSISRTVNVRTTRRAVVWAVALQPMRCLALSLTVPNQPRDTRTHAAIRNPALPAPHHRSRLYCLSE